jgi:hypothetical protein
MTGQPSQITVHEVLNRVRLLPLVVLDDHAAAAPLGETLVQAGLRRPRRDPGSG